MKKSKILILFLVIVLIASLFTGCVPTIPSSPSKITNAENKYKNSNIILDIPYFNAQGVTNGCGCAAGAMLMNYYNYLDVEPADLAPYIMVPESKYWETFGLLAGIEVYIKYYNYDDNLKTELKILTIKDIKRKIDEGFPVAVLQYSDLPRITENLHYRVVHGYDDEKLEFICSCSLGEDYPMDYSEFINLNLLPVDKCPALIVEPKNIDFSYLDVVPAEGSVPHKVHLAGYVRAVVSPFHCKVDFGDGTPIEEGTGNEFLSLYHTYANEGKFIPVLYVEDNLGRKGKAKANTITVTSSTQDENKTPFISGDSFAGYEWDVRNYPGKPGSEDQIWSDSINNIWMDDLGQLHFRLTKKNNNKWNCVEIFSQKTDWGYGKYEFDFEIVSDGKIDENVMIGLYAYSDSPELYHGEFDYEFTYWSSEGLDPSNNSTVGWQGDPPHCNKRFFIPVNEGYPAKIVLSWNYGEDEELHCYYECGNIVGDFSLPQEADDEDAQTTKPPTELNQRVYMNLWLETGKPYNLEEIEEVEVVIKDFDFKEKPEDVNRPPEISDLTANPSSVDINQTTTITCIASDPDGDPLTYYWTKNGGSFEGGTSGSTVTWRAPSTPGNYTVTCEVSDGELSDSEQFNIPVGDITIQFEDPNLEQVVRETINKPEGLLYLSDVIGITTLVANEREIESLGGIQHLQQLQFLDFTNNQVSDISVLSNLTNLENLKFHGNQVSDISVLSNLTNLGSLQFLSNQVSDISSVSNLTNLGSLEFASNQVSDISSVSNLTNLENLRFDSNQVSDISSVSNLTNLRYLSFYNNQVSDISPISNLTNLQILRLWDNQVSDISPISNLVSLKNLHFLGNPVSDISSVSNLTNLEYLDFRETQVSDISALSTLINLGRLYFYNAQVSDISPLVINEGLSTGDYINMVYNYLDLTEGSQDM